MSKPIAQIKTTDLFGEDGPQTLQYPDGIYLADGGPLHKPTAAQLTTLRTMLAREATHVTECPSPGHFYRRRACPRSAPSRALGAGRCAGAPYADARPDGTHTDWSAPQALPAGPDNPTGVTYVLPHVDPAGPSTRR